MINFFVKLFSAIFIRFEKIIKIYFLRRLIQNIMFYGSLILIGQQLKQGKIRCYKAQTLLETLDRV